MGILLVIKLGFFGFWVEKILGYRDSDEDIQQIKQDILYTTNQIEKSMNQRQYKKDKHSSSKFKDWE